jgi:RecA-family ATPase
VTETSRDGLALTALHEWLSERMKDIEVLVIDGASDAFDWNEVVRRAVRFFIRTVRKLIPKTGAVILLAHVDKPAAKMPGTSQGYSGSTAWHNSVRARWYLRPAKAQEDNDEPDELVLECQKSNHSGHGQRLTLRWSDEAHLFVGEALPATTRLDRELADADAREQLVELIRAASVPIPAAMTGQRTAYHVLSAMALPEVYVRDRRRFARDLEALRVAGKVVDVERRTADRKVRTVLGVA